MWSCCKDVTSYIFVIRFIQICIFMHGCYSKWLIFVLDWFLNIYVFVWHARGGAWACQCLSVCPNLWYKAINPDATGRIVSLRKLLRRGVKHWPHDLSCGVTIRSNFIKYEMPDCYEKYRAHLYFPEDKNISISLLYCQPCAKMLELESCMPQSELSK